MYSIRQGAQMLRLRSLLEFSSLIGHKYSIALNQTQMRLECGFRILTVGDILLVKRAGEGELLDFDVTEVWCKLDLWVRRH